MKIFKNTDKQSRSPALELAISEAKGAFVTLRHGDAEEDRKAGDIGVRVVICDFGNYQPFVLKKQTKDWLQRTYDLSEDEAIGVYRILLGKAKEQIRDLEESRRHTSNLGANFKSLSDQFRPIRW